MRIKQKPEVAVAVGNIKDMQKFFALIKGLVKRQTGKIIQAVLPLHGFGHCQIFILVIKNNHVDFFTDIYGHILKIKGKNQPVNSYIRIFFGSKYIKYTLYTWEVIIP